MNDGFGDSVGNDIVLGTTGNDVIYTAFGVDIALGGGGADRFIYEDEGDNRGGPDIIQDFKLADDILDFTEIGTAGDVNLSVSEGVDGYALLTSIYTSIELVGITSDQIDPAGANFVFA